LYPLAELAAVAGCTFKFVAELGGHIPMHNHKMETPLQGLFVAGNITGIESAKVAIAQGVVAGLSLSLNAGKDNLLSRLEEAIMHVETVREQALIQFHPDIQAGRRKLEAEWRLLAT
jgi:sarcosine oxidase subunit alpha